MNISRLVLLEIGHRKSSFALALVSVAIAVACLVGAQTLLTSDELLTGQLLTEKRAEVNAAIKKYLDPSNLQIAVVTGDAEGLKQALVSERFAYGQGTLFVAKHIDIQINRRICNGVRPFLEKLPITLQQRVDPKQDHEASSRLRMV